VQYNDKQRRRSKSTNANVAEISGPNARPRRTRTMLASEPPLFLQKGILGALHHPKRLFKHISSPACCVDFASDAGPLPIAKDQQVAALTRANS
jgi:hypothetical protein